MMPATKRSSRLGAPSIATQTIQRLQRFQGTHGVTQRRVAHVCLARLFQKVCPNGDADEPDCRASMLPGAAHCSEWVKEKKTWGIVSQPREWSWDMMVATVDFCRAHDLTVSMSALDSWHSPGTTILILYQKAEGATLWH